MKKPNTANLTDYPHIVFKLNDIWGTRTCREYLQGLIFNTSGRVNDTPQGFSIATLNVITKLLEDHDRLFPQYLALPTVWNKQPVL
jgi:hypothetical protein